MHGLVGVMRMFDIAYTMAKEGINEIILRKEGLTMAIVVLLVLVLLVRELNPGLAYNMHRRISTGLSETWLESDNQETNINIYTLSLQ